MSDFAIAPDQPISDPGQDVYGLNGFAEAIAASVLRIEAPDGTVIALNGRWGAGKTSTINLVCHCLSEAIEADEIQIVPFHGWWFQGEEALAYAFFGELQAAMRPGLSGKARRLIPKLGKNLLQAGSALGSAVALSSGAGVGALTTGVVDWLNRTGIKGGSVARLHAQIAKALAEQSKRYLVIIDDMDRLEPDEALTVFRLIKSVGRLPNVMYLLAYDREIAERVVAERYPSEGPHFLEKIIQASFDLPLPDEGELRHRALNEIRAVCGDPGESEHTDIGNAFYETVAPEIRTPRDLVRYANALRITWPAVSGDVYLADFIAIEALRLFQPEVYGAVRRQKDAICSPKDNLSQDERRAYYDTLLLGDAGENERERIRKSLMRLFPQLQAIWINVHYQHSGPIWTRQRRICSKQHFDTYFRFSLAVGAVSKAEVEHLTQNASDREVIRKAFETAVQTPTREGGTRASLLFDELTVYAPSIAKRNVRPLLSTLFEMADALIVPADQMPPFGGFGSELRLFWLTRELVQDRFGLEERSALIADACRGAALGWRCYLAQSVYHEHFPDDEERKELDACLIDEATTIALRDQTLAAIREAAVGGELIDHNDLAYILFRWRNFAEDGGAEVIRWTDEQLATDQAVLRFSRAFTSQSSSWGMGIQGLGDHVARRHTTASVKPLPEIMDRDRFHARLEEIKDGETSSAAAKRDANAFLRMWKEADGH